MNPEDLKVGMRVWAWWRSELLLYTGKRTRNYSYQFENFGDQERILEFEALTSFAAGLRDEDEEANAEEAESAVPEPAKPE